MDRQLIFRGTKKGRGKLHISYAENPFKDTPSEVKEPKLLASCGLSKVELDPEGEVRSPIVGRRLGESGDSFCEACLRFTIDPATEVRVQAAKPTREEFMRELNDLRAEASRERGF